ncbi:MAG TPA: HD domain-containing protein [Acidimicrobiales bacterium]|nr:HD domain-containing protein [Acidimicrobiales bacterium]
MSQRPWHGEVNELRVVLDAMSGFFDEDEPVDELQHALQCATHALSAGADPELLAAAFLHDVGRAPPVSELVGPMPHERAGALWLGPRASAKVAWLVGAHVQAKVSLVRSDPRYTGALSAASVASLQRQQRDETDLARWVSHPWWPEALQLRRWDDASKIAGAATASIEDVLKAMAQV